MFSYTLNDEKRRIVFALEAAFLVLLVLAQGVNLVMGDDSAAYMLLEAIYVPGLVLCAGIYMYLERKNTKALLIHGLLYWLFFILVNQLVLVGLEHLMFFRSLVRSMALLQIRVAGAAPFAISVAFLCAAILAKYADKILGKAKIAIAVCAVFLLFTFLPGALFGYPQLGVFFGCDTYHCTPLLPVAYMFLAGMYIGSKELEPEKGVMTKLLLASVLLSVVGAGLYVIHMTALAKMLIGAFPIAVITLFAFKVKIYQKFAALILKICRAIENWILGMIHDFTSSNFKRKRVFVLFYTIAFVIVTCIVYMTFIEQKVEPIWINDTMGKYLPRAYYFINYMHECIAQALHGNFNFPHYDFTIGMGGTISFLNDPIYYVLLLFPASKVEFAYCFMTMLRLYLAGLSFSALCLYFKRKFPETMLASFVYVFCGYALYVGAIHTQCVEPMITLPLLIIATEEMIQHKRWYFSTVLIAMSLLSGYYYTYIDTLAMGVFYLVRFALIKDETIKTWKNFFVTTFSFAGAYITGVIIGNVSLVTSFASYLSSSRSGSGSFAALSPLYYNDRWLLRVYEYFISAPLNPGFGLRLGFAPLAFIAVVALFLRKGYKEVKILVGICLICCVFPYAGYALCGFSSISNRWIYATSLMVAYALVCVFSELDKLTKKDLKILLLAAVPYLVITLVHGDYRNEQTLAGLAVLATSYIVLIGMNKEVGLFTRKNGKILLATLCIISLGLNGYFHFNSGDKTNYDRFKHVGTAMDTLRSKPLCVFENTNDIKDDFYRVTTAKEPLASSTTSMVGNYRSLATYLSTLNSATVDYNLLMANTSSPYMVVQFGTFDNRAFLNATAAVKYYSVNKGDEAYIPYGYKHIDEVQKDDKTFEVYENEYALPLGFTYSNVISESDLEKYPTEQRQEVLLQAATLSDKHFEGTTIPKAKKADILSTSFGAKIKSWESDGVSYEDGQLIIEKPAATLTLKYDRKAGCENYLYINGYLNSHDDEGTDSLFIHMDNEGNKMQNYTFSRNSNYSAGQDEYIYNLGYSEEDREAEVSFFFAEAGTYTMNEAKIVYQPMTNYESYIEGLGEETLENLNIGTDELSGTITVDSKKLLVLSIPYQSGWKAYVDGVETEIKKADITYMGLELEPGTHEIELKYTLPGLSLSHKLTALGILMLIGGIVIRVIRKKRNKR